MNLSEKPTNTAARYSNGPERSRWRNEGVDPELVGNPHDMVVGSQPPTVTAGERDISLQVAEQSRVATQKFTPHPALQGVQLSFESR